MASTKSLCDEANEMSASARKLVEATLEAVKNNAAVAEEAGEVVKAAVAKVDSSFAAVLEEGKKRMREADEVIQKQIESISKTVSSVNEICNEGDAAASAEKGGNLNLVSADKGAEMDPATTPPPSGKNDGENSESGLDGSKSPTPVKPATRSNRLAPGKKIAKVRTGRNKKAAGDNC